MDVPDFLTYVPSTLVERMSVPGAATSTQVPKLESPARVSSGWVLATERTLGQAPGHCWKLLPLLPAVATSTTPLFHALLMLSRSSLTPVSVRSSTHDGSQSSHVP